MSVTDDPRHFFTERHALYARFIRTIPYSKAFRAFFLASPLGFSQITFPGFPPSARYLSVWGHVVEAQR